MKKHRWGLTKLKTGPSKLIFQVQLFVANWIYFRKEPASIFARVGNRKRQDTPAEYCAKLYVDFSRISITVFSEAKPGVKAQLSKIPRNLIQVDVISRELLCWITTGWNNDRLSCSQESGVSKRVSRKRWDVDYEQSLFPRAKRARHENNRATPSFLACRSFAARRLRACAIPQ